ncbi:MAG: hypothetical protein ACK5N7_06635, partial [Curvibacter sp.]
DSSLWYLVADANGLSSDRELRVGQTLNVPSRVTGGANNSNTFKPYNPGEVVGDTTPNLPSPPVGGGGGGGGCGGLGTILVIVVTVAVAIYAPQLLPNLGNAFLNAAAAAAVGNVAGQVVGNALGAQEGFSWKAVAMAAISGGVTQGMGGTNFTGGADASLGNTIARAAVSNAMTQGIAVVTGLQEKFSWTSVAASAVGAGVGHGMNQALGLTDAAGKATSNYQGYQGMDRIARAALSGFAAGTATTLARGGRVAVTQIATDAFGNALGSSLGGEMAKSAAEERLAQERAKQRTHAYQVPMVDPDTGDHIEMGALLAPPRVRSIAGISTAELIGDDTGKRFASLELRGDDKTEMVLLADASRHIGSKVVSDAGGGGNEHDELIAGTGFKLRPGAGRLELDANSVGDAGSGPGTFDLDDMRAQFGPDAITGFDPAPEKPSARSAEPGKAAPGNGKANAWTPDRPELGSASDYQKRADEQKRYAEQMRGYAAAAEKSGDARTAAEYRRMEAGYLNAAGLEQARAATIQAQTGSMWERVKPPEFKPGPDWSYQGANASGVRAVENVIRSEEDIRSGTGRCPNFCVRAIETCPRRRASLATNDRRGGQVGATSYAASFVKRSS